MHIIGAQYNKISGPDATANYKVEFTVDESQREGILELAKRLKKGASLLLLIFEADKDENEIKELVNETPVQTRNRLNKQMYAIIRAIARDKNIDAGDIKKSLKTFLIQKKYIKQSSKELTLAGLSAAIYYLKTEY